MSLKRYFNNGRVGLFSDLPSSASTGTYIFTEDTKALYFYGVDNLPFQIGKNISLSGGTFSNGVLMLNNSDGSSVSVSGFTSGGSGDTNVYVGGVASQFQTKASFAALLLDETLNNLNPNNISDFEIVGSDIKMNINIPYHIKPSSFISNQNITSYIDGGNCVFIGGNVFNGATNLTKIIFDGVRVIGQTVFANCGLSGILKFDSLHTAGPNCFLNSQLTELICPKLLKISNNFMSGSSTLTNIKDYFFPNVIEVGDNPFSNNIVSVNLPNVRKLGFSNFKLKASFTTLIAPKLEEIGRETFWQAPVVNLDLPSLKKVTDGFYTFNSTTLRVLNIPNCLELGVSNTMSSLFVGASPLLVVNAHKSLKFNQSNNTTVDPDIQYLTNTIGATVNYVGDGFVNDIGVKGITFQDNFGANLGESKDVIKLKDFSWDNNTKILSPYSRFLQFKNSTTLNGNTHGSFISESGVWVAWTVQGASNLVYSAYLDKPFDISSLVTTSIASYSTGDANEGISISPDGSRMYLSSNINGTPTLKQYTLSSKFSVNTATLVSSEDLSSSFPIQSVSDIYMTPDGTKFWVANSSQNEILIFDVTTPYQISSLSVTNSYPITAINNLGGITFGNDGYEFYAGSHSTGMFYFQLNVPYDLLTNRAVEQITYLPQNTTRGLHATNKYNYIFSSVNTSGQIIKNLL